MSLYVIDTVDQIFPLGYQNIWQQKSHLVKLFKSTFKQSQ